MIDRDIWARNISFCYLHNSSIEYRLLFKPY